MPRIKCNLPEYPSRKDIEKCDGVAYGCQRSKEKCEHNI